MAGNKRTCTDIDCIYDSHPTDNSTHSKIAKMHKTSHSSFDAYLLNKGYYLFKK